MTFLISLLLFLRETFLKIADSCTVSKPAWRDRRHIAEYPLHDTSFILLELFNKLLPVLQSFHRG